MGFFCLCGEPAVPGEASAGPEGDEEVVEAESGAEADGEDGEEEVGGEEGGRVDVFSCFGEAERAVRKVADGEADGGAEEALPEDGAEEPLFDCGGDGGFDDGEDANVEKRKGDAVVATGFGREHVANTAGDTFGKPRVEHRGCEDGVGRREAGTDDKSG